jgi:hypothetical protein
LDLLKIKLSKDKKIVIETLSRMGIKNHIKNIIYPSCYIHNIDGECYLCHFKEMFLITRSNGFNNISEEDIERRNSIAFLLKKWKMIDIDDKLISNHKTKVFVLSYKDKKDYKIEHKFNYSNCFTGY